MIVRFSIIFVLFFHCALSGMEGNSPKFANTTASATASSDRSQMLQQLYAAIVYDGPSCEDRARAYLASLPPTATITQLNPILPNLFPAMHFVASKGKTTLVRLFAQKLQTHHINPNLPDANGNTPLHFAAGYDHTETAQCLVEEFQANINQENASKKTPFNVAGSLVRKYFEDRTRDIIQQLSALHVSPI